MKLRLLLLGLLLVFLAGCSTTPEEEVAQKRHAKVLCQNKLEPLSKKLGTSLDKKDLAASETLFLKMERYALEMWMDRYPRHEPENLTTFKEHSKKLHQVAHQGALASGEKDLEKAKNQLKLLKRRCEGCHTEYRFNF